MCVKKIAKRLNRLPSWLVPIVLTLGFAILLYLAIWTYPDVKKEKFVLEDGVRIPVHSVRLGSDKAYPDALTFPVGQYVEFYGEGDTTYNIGLGGGSENGKAHEHIEQNFASGAFGRGEAYRVKVEKVGVYDFHDHNRPELFTTVITY